MVDGRTWIDVGFVVVVIMLAILLWRARRRRPRDATPQTFPESTVVDAPKQRYEKCHTVKYRYADGTCLIVHSICDGDGKRHDDAYGQALNPESPLLETIGGVHLVEWQ